MTNTISEIAHGIAKIAHNLTKNTSQKASDFLKSKGIKEVNITTWNSLEGRIIIAKGSGEFYNVEHDTQLRRSLLNIVLFSTGEKSGEERLSQAMDAQVKHGDLLRVKIPTTRTKNTKIIQLFPKIS